MAARMIVRRMLNQRRLSFKSALPSTHGLAAATVNVKHHIAIATVQRDDIPFSPAGRHIMTGTWRNAVRYTGVARYNVNAWICSSHDYYCHFHA